MRINQELRDNIIIDIKNEVNYKYICDKYKISKNSVYKIKKELEKENTEEEQENTEKENEEELNEEEKENTEKENEDYSVDKEIFDIEEFKNELNNDEYNENENEIENNDEIIEDKIIENEVIQPVVILNKNIISNDNSFISKSSYKSNNSRTSKKSIKNVSFKKKKPINNINNNNNENNKNNIDVIKNTDCNNGDIEDLKKRRSSIIIIKQYLSTFDEDLKSINSPNKCMFEKRLFTLNYDQLLTILENIRTTLNIKQNKSNFIVLSSNVIKGIETISNYTGYDVDG